MITLEQGWNEIFTEGIRPLELFLDSGVIPYGSNDEGGTSSSSSCSTIDSTLQGSLQETNKRVSLFRHRRFMQLYTVVYNMSTQRTESNWSKQLYDRHGDTINDYIQSKVLPRLSSLTGKPLLVEFQRHWENHLIMNDWMEKIFCYLVAEKYYQDLRDALIDLINQERDGIDIDVTLLKTLISMYLILDSDDLGLYQSEFERFLFPETEKYYATKADQWLTEKTFGEYMSLVENALTEETQRSIHYLHESTCAKLLAVVQKALLSDRMDRLLSMNTSIMYLLENGKRDDLKRTFALFGFLDNGHDPLANAFRSHIAKLGNNLIQEHSQILASEIIEAKEKEIKNVKTLVQKQLTNTRVVDDLLNLHAYYKQFASECFNQELLFHRALKEAFEEFMNKNISTHFSAAFLSSYCDQVMRSRRPHTTDASIDHILTKIVELFSFLTDKDLFADIYRTQLARRLLTDTSSSSDVEKLMITKLKLSCGTQFTSRLEGMLNDLGLANDTQKEFKNEIVKLSSSSIGTLTQDRFSATVLTTGYWPTYQTPDVCLPNEMQLCLNSFTDFYTKQKTSHRRLTWVHHLGTVVLTSRFSDNKVYDIQCNTFQACLLLLFNTADNLSQQVISDTLRLDPLLTKKNIASFIVVRLLVKNKTGDDTEEYSVNLNFGSKQRLIKVPVPMQEEIHNKDKVEEDRSVAIEAAIVRIMKARKKLNHTELVMEVLNQLSFFKPNPRVIKTKVESLIDREFLERSPDNPQLYLYVA